MLNEKGIYVTIGGQNEKAITIVAYEIADRLNRLGYAANIRSVHGIEMTTSQGQPVYIVIQNTMPKKWPGM